MTDALPMKELHDLQKTVLQAITPRQNERKATLNFVRKLERDLAAQLHSSGIEAEVGVQGSIAKDTWLAGETDVDLFILLPPTRTKTDLIDVLQTVKSFVGDRWIEAYAEHPYLIAEVEGYQVDFVPGFKIENAANAISSVDRSPLHTAYMTQHLTPSIRNEVRLFKQFSRGTGTYGAEIKVKGLSGYLCELLILHYQSFLTTLRAVASWKVGQLIDVGQRPRGQNTQVKHMFNDHLIVIDPVDPKRNVASAVSVEKLGQLMLAANFFLLSPTRSYFFPAPTIPSSPNVLKDQLKKLPYDVLFLAVPIQIRPPDVLWGQIYKTARALKKLLLKNDFQVIRSGTWSNETDTVILIYVLETTTIPMSKLHRGPPIDSMEAIPFIQKYARADKTELGSWIEDGRWVVKIKRQHPDAIFLLHNHLQSGSKNIGVARGLTANLQQAQLHTNQEILPLYSMHEDFARFFTEFLFGRPKWMQSTL
ncbi:MAG: CCA tRNA nucleotidyltransferase [Candidatus Bathyarchaeota archaeon]|nr:MAG: CCA tRNA nucleotidyltransferase [Candidatus Bathyarchaeota archaeon]